MGVIHIFTVVFFQSLCLVVWVVLVVFFQGLCFRFLVLGFEVFLVLRLVG